nr:uncharacterized protein LOC119627358 [Chlorocebus sabaeus]
MYAHESESQAAGRPTSSAAAPPPDARTRALPRRARALPSSAARLGPDPSAATTHAVPPAKWRRKHEAPPPPGSLCALAGGDARPDGPHRKGPAGTEEKGRRGPGCARGSSPGHRPQGRGHPERQHQGAGRCLPTAPRTLRTSGTASAAPCGGPKLRGPDCNRGPPTAARNAQGGTERQPRPSDAVTTPFFPPLLPPRESVRHPVAQPISTLSSTSTWTLLQDEPAPYFVVAYGKPGLLQLLSSLVFGAPTSASPESRVVQGRVIPGGLGVGAGRRAFPREGRARSHAYIRSFCSGRTDVSTRRRHEVVPPPFAVFLFTFASARPGGATEARTEMGSCCVAQAGLELDSDCPPASASQSARITGVSHCIPSPRSLMILPFSFYYSAESGGIEELPPSRRGEGVLPSDGFLSAALSAIWLLLNISSIHKTGVCKCQPQLGAGYKFFPAELLSPR